MLVVLERRVGDDVVKATIWSAQHDRIPAVVQMLARKGDAKHTFAQRLNGCEGCNGEDEALRIINGPVDKFLRCIATGNLNPFRSAARGRKNSLQTRTAGGRWYWVLNRCSGNGVG